MARVIVGVFPDSLSAERATASLKDAGFDPTRIGIMTRDGGLSGFDMSQAEAEYYQRRARDGATLMTVDASGQEAEARQILLRSGAEDTWSTAPWQSPAERENTRMGVSQQSPQAAQMTPDAAPLHRTAPIIPPNTSTNWEYDTTQQMYEAGNPHPQAAPGAQADTEADTEAGKRTESAPDRGSVVGPGDAIQNGPATNPFAGELQSGQSGEGAINYGEPALGQPTPTTPDGLPPERPPK